jgi:cation transport regulator
MPYRTIQDLPINLREILPVHAQEIFVKSFNNAWQEYQDVAKRPEEISQEEIAFRIAWNAVKRKYAKNKRTRKWELKESVSERK